MPNSNATPTIVLAEDVEDLLEVLRDMVEEDGYKVVGVAADGQDAIVLIERLKPDLALLDYRLPGADGLEILRAIRDASPETRAVMLTAYDEASLRMTAEGLGAYAFLVKGCPASQILQALRETHEAKRTS